MINVLFLCIGNSCRSQIAEGFARAYGSDVMHAFSAGLAPAAIVQPLTVKVMLEKNINIENQFPKDVAELETQAFDMIVNITGNRMPIRVGAEVRDWFVSDPMGQSEEMYLIARDKLEGLVMQLILELRRRELGTKPRPVSKRAARVVPPAAPARPAAPPRPAAPAKPAVPAAAKKPTVDVAFKPSRIGFGRIRTPRD